MSDVNLDPLIGRDPMDIAGPQAPSDHRRVRSRAHADLRFLGPGDPDHLDWDSAYYVRPGQLLRLMTRQLFSYPASDTLSDPQSALIPVPDVALELPTKANGGVSEDHCTYTIRLRDGVLWDTTPPREVTAGDFVRGIKRVAYPRGADARPYFTSTIVGMAEYCSSFESNRSARAAADDVDQLRELNDVAGLQALDDKRLQIRLTRPANDFLNILAMGFASAAPVEYDRWARDDPAFRRSLISNGPYRLAQCSPDSEEIWLEHNPVWRQDCDPIRQQKIDLICVHAPAQSIKGSLREIAAENLDLAWSFTIISWAKPTASSDNHFPHNYPGFTLNPYLVFNLQSPNQRGAIRDRKVRQAIAYAIDKRAIGAILDRLPGVATLPLHSVIPPGGVGYRSFNPYPTIDDRGNPDRAREFLVEAGYAEGLTLIAVVRDIGLHLEVMRSIANDVRRCGIELQLRICDPAEYYGRLLSDPAKGKAGLWDIAEPGWTPDWFGNNGRATVRPLFQTNPNPGTFNYGHYSNSTVDRLISEALGETDPSLCADLWHQVDRHIMADLPVVPILAFACRCCAARSGAGWGTWPNQAFLHP